MKPYIPNEPTVDFDWQAVEAANPDTHSEAVVVAAQALKLTLEWLWRSQSAVNTPLARRLCAMLLVLRSTEPGFRTYTEAARALGCTRAAMSKDAVQFCDRFHVHLGQKSDTHRKHLSRARVEVIQKSHAGSGKAKRCKITSV